MFLASISCYDSFCHQYTLTDPSVSKHGYKQMNVLERLICSISFAFEHHVNSIISLKSK